MTGTIHQADRTVEQQAGEACTAPVGTGGTADSPISRTPHPATPYVAELVAASWDPARDEPLLIAPASWGDIDRPVRDAITTGLVKRRHDGVLVPKSKPPTVSGRGSTTTKEHTP